VSEAEPLTPEAADGPGGLLAAALIVKNEAAHLAACLASVRPVVDDIVVVDTGSTDETTAVATTNGARVFHFPWRDDFAAARNAGLDQCRTDWILYIDADERLAPVSRGQVEVLLRDAREVAFRLLLRPVIGSTPYREYRLWRNDPRIRFRSAIHEKVVPSIHAVAAMDRRPIGRCDLLLEHVGYEGDQTRKHLRNLPMLRRQVQSEPENLFVWHHLARVLAGLGEARESEEVLEHAIDISRAKSAVDYCGVLLYSELVGMRMARGENAADLIAEGRRLYPDNYVLIWQEARAMIAAGRPEQALAGFDRLLAADVASLPDRGPAYEERLFDEAAHEGRGLCLFRLGRYAEAAAAYEQAEQCAPGNREYTVKRQLAQALSIKAPRPRPSLETTQTAQTMTTQTAQTMTTQTAQTIRSSP
jgi:glycosyltransferase involved in cell wall biosynthesis